MGIPPVPPVPFQFINGKEHVKEKERESDKSVEREREKDREEGRSSKEFDRKASPWFKRRSIKPTRDEREKEKEKGKDRDVGAAPVPTVTPSQSTTSATVLSTTPSQSDAGSSVGATSLWRRSSARLGYHVKRLSGTHSSTALGELDPAVAVGSPPGSSSMAPHSQHHQPSRQLSAVPATPQSPRPDQEPYTPTTSASDSPTFPPALVPYRSPPLAGTDDGLLPPLAKDADAGVDVGAPGSAPLPAWRISPAHPPSHQDATTSVVPHPASEPPSSTNDNDDPIDEHRYQHLFSNLLLGRRRGRPHSVHGSGSNTPRERSASSYDTPLPQAALAAKSGSTTVLPGSLANGASSSSSSSASAPNGKEREKEKEPAKARRGTRKLSLHVPMFSLGGLGFGLGGREKDREKERDHLGKREDSKRAHKVHTPGAGAAVASVAR